MLSLSIFLLGLGAGALAIPSSGKKGSQPSMLHSSTPWTGSYANDNHHCHGEPLWSQNLTLPSGKDEPDYINFGRKSQQSKSWLFLFTLRTS